MKESEDLKMKVAVTKTLFEKIPGLCKIGRAHV